MKGDAPGAPRLLQEPCQPALRVPTDGLPALPEVRVGAEGPVVARAHGEMGPHLVVGGLHPRPGQDLPPDPGAVRGEVVHHLHRHLPGVDAVAHHHRLDVLHPAHPHRRSRERPVDAEPQSCVEPHPVASHALPVEGDGTGDDLRLEEGPGADLCVAGRVAPDPPLDGVPVAPGDDGAAHQDQSGVALEGRHLDLQASGRRLVVGVEDREVAPPGHVHAGVERRSLPAVPAQSNQPEARVGPRHLLRHLRGPVGGTVIHHDHLEVVERLAGERGERAPEVTVGLVGRHHGGHERAPAPHPGATSSPAGRSAARRRPACAPGGREGNSSRSRR